MEEENEKNISVVFNNNRPPPPQRKMSASLKERLKRCGRYYSTPSPTLSKKLPQSNQALLPTPDATPSSLPTSSKKPTSCTPTIHDPIIPDTPPLYNILTPSSQTEHSGDLSGVKNLTSLSCTPVLKSKDNQGTLPRAKRLRLSTRACFKDRLLSEGPENNEGVELEIPNSHGDCKLHGVENNEGIKVEISNFHGDCNLHGLENKEKIEIELEIPNSHGDCKLHGLKNYEGVAIETSKSSGDCKLHGLKNYEEVAIETSKSSGDCKLHGLKNYEEVPLPGDCKLHSPENYEGVVTEIPNSSGDCKLHHTRTLENNQTCIKPAMSPELVRDVSVCELQDSRNGLPEDLSLEELAPIKLRLQKELQEKQESLRKLRMVKFYREKNDLITIGKLIKKWTGVCQEAVMELYEKLTEPKPSLQGFLEHLKIDLKFIRFDPEEETFY